MGAALPGCRMDTGMPPGSRNRSPTASQSRHSSLLGARSLLTALGSLPLGCSLYGVYLALVQTHVMNRAKQEDPEGWWPNEHPGRGLAVLLALAAAGLAMMAAGWNLG